MPRKLDTEDQDRVKSYLENLARIYGVFVIVRVCCNCGTYLGVKDGEGVHGISHVQKCDNCKKGE